MNTREISPAGPKMTRRTAVMTIGAAGVLGGCASLPNLTASEDALVTPDGGSLGRERNLIRSWGGDGGTMFETEYPRLVGLRGAWAVDALLLNGTRHGGDGGEQTAQLRLAPGEYINEMPVRTGYWFPFGEVVLFLGFRTNLGHAVAIGSSREKMTRLKNIRVLALGGRSGKLLDQITVDYIENYRPSRVVAEDAVFILEMIPPNTERTTYLSSRSKSIDAFQRVLAFEIASKMSVGATAEFAAKVNTTAELSIKSTSTSTISKTLEQELTKSQTDKFNSGKNYAFRIARYDIMEGDEGATWLLPTAEASLRPYTRKQYRDLRGAYSLITGAEQVLGLKVRREHGFQMLY